MSKVEAIVPLAVIFGILLGPAIYVLIAALI